VLQQVAQQRHDAGGADAILGSDPKQMPSHWATGKTVKAPITLTF